MKQNTALVFLASLAASVSATWSNHGQLYERDIAARPARALRPRQSPTPGRAYTLTFGSALSTDAPTYLQCAIPTGGSVAPEILYYPDGTVTLRCTRFNEGRSVCDYDALTGEYLTSSNNQNQDLVNSCKASKAIQITPQAQCATTCVGPSPFVYATVDPTTSYTICFFETQTAGGLQQQAGCFYNSNTGAALTPINSGTNCASVSVQAGRCAAV